MSDAPTNRWKWKAKVKSQSISVDLDGTASGHNVAEATNRIKRNVAETLGVEPELVIVYKIHMTGVR
ncbi:hypothetical protein [Vibrio owensii]|uniref:hypothetical protein n=1 Tax=Vibrio owensii TaxID=696485 RepID=UPI003CE4C0DA